LFVKRLLALALVVIRDSLFVIREISDRTHHLIPAITMKPVRSWRPDRFGRRYYSLTSSSVTIYEVIKHKNIEIQKNKSQPLIKPSLANRQPPIVNL